MTPREIYDSMLLSMIEAWADLHDQQIRNALQIPESYYWEEYEGGEVPEIVLHQEMLENSSEGVLRAARELVSQAEEAGIINRWDWSIIKSILWFAGTDCPLTEVLYPYISEEDDYDNPAF